MKLEDPSPQSRKDEQTVVSLLTHLQHLRGSVPVNYRLKGELKKQLLQRMQELEVQTGEGAANAHPEQKSRTSRLIAAMVIVAVTVAVYSWWEKDLLAVEEHAVICSLPLDEKQRPFAVSLPLPNLDEQHGVFSGQTNGGRLPAGMVAGRALFGVHPLGQRASPGAAHGQSDGAGTRRMASVTISWKSRLNRVK